MSARIANGLSAHHTIQTKHPHVECKLEHASTSSEDESRREDRHEARRAPRRLQTSRRADLSCKHVLSNQGAEPSPALCIGRRRCAGVQERSAIMMFSFLNALQSSV